MRSVKRASSWTWFAMALSALFFIDPHASEARGGRLRASTPEGYYVLQSVDKAGNVRDSDLTPANIAGLSVRFSWAQLEPQRGVYDWTDLDAEVERVRGLGKKITIRPMAGVYAPAWLYDEGAESTISEVQGATMPVPWDPIMLSAWVDFVTELGARYNWSRAVSLVHLSGPVADSAEMHLPASLMEDPQAIEKVYAAWTVAIDAYAAAFRRKPLSLNASNPFDGNDGLAESVSDYLTLIAGQRAVLQNNSLSAGTDRRFNVFQLLVDRSALGVVVGFQMLTYSGDSRFGGPFSRAIFISEDAAPSFYEIYPGDVPRVPE